MIFDELPQILRCAVNVSKANHMHILYVHSIIYIVLAVATDRCKIETNVQRTHLFF